MVKYITVALLCLTMIGCANVPRIKTEVQEKHVPILYCPAPPEVIRPELAIDALTPEMMENPGEVVKHYKATIIQLQGLTVELETILKQYDQNNEAYEELERQFKEKWESE